MTSYPNCEEEFPEQWNRLVNSQGDPVPKRASKNGKTAEELETWADNCVPKISYYMGKASGDGFWESKVHWFEQRVASLREDAAVLRKEGPPAKARVSHYTPYSVSGRPAMTSSAIRPLYPTPGRNGPMHTGEAAAPIKPFPFNIVDPVERQNAYQADVDRLFPPFKPPRKLEKDVDLSVFSISKTEEEDGKKLVAYTPPSSPSEEE